MTEPLKIGDFVESTRYGAGQPKIEGTIISISGDRAKVSLARKGDWEPRWRNLRRKEQA